MLSLYFPTSLEKFSNPPNKIPSITVLAIVRIAMITNSHILSSVTSKISPYYKKHLKCKGKYIEK